MTPCSTFKYLHHKISLFCLHGPPAVQIVDQKKTTCAKQREHTLAPFSHTRTDLLSLLEGEELEVQVVWELDMRVTNFWMVLRDGALIRELRRLWYFWNKLSTWTWKTVRAESGSMLLAREGAFVLFCFLKCASPFYLKVLEGLSPEQWVGWLQLEDSQHDEKHMDAEGPSATAAGLNGNGYAVVGPSQVGKLLTDLYQLKA